MIQEEPTDSYTKHMFHVFLLCDKPSRSSSGSNPIAATIKKALRIKDFLLFCLESGIEKYDTHTLEMVLFCTKLHKII